MNAKRNAARESAQTYRTKMKRLGFRQVNLWVPDTRSPNFRKECRRQSQLAAAADKSERIDGLLEGAAGSVEGWM
ncbi:MAG TPA: antitoxin MazE family protein [Woeseiaceae bacterium]|nr:antitoxin MazE family protein [Woeseiaceae bacterium]